MQPDFQTVEIDSFTADRSGTPLGRDMPRITVTLSERTKSSQTSEKKFIPCYSHRCSHMNWNNKNTEDHLFCHLFPHESQFLYPHSKARPLKNILPL